MEIGHITPLKVHVSEFTFIKRLLCTIPFEWAICSDLTHEHAGSHWPSYQKELAILSTSKSRPVAGSPSLLNNVGSWYAVLTGIAGPERCR
jgi:hypothetical protein